MAHRRRENVASFAAAVSNEHGAALGCCILCEQSLVAERDAGGVVYADGATSMIRFIMRNNRAGHVHARRAVCIDCAAITGYIAFKV